jgi:hypothetical protein
MPVTGGLTGTLDGETGCGDGSGTATGGYIVWDSSALGARVTATFQGSLPSQSGSYTLASLQIQSSTTGGSTQSWKAPSGACVIQVDSVDVECQAVFDQNVQVLHGTGKCTQPAAPESGTSASAVTIGDFPFEHWL